MPTNPFTAEGLSVPNSNPTQRLTVGQAVVQFLAAQRVERDGDTQPFFGGAIGIFGHGNVAGIGQALLQYRKDFRLYQARNEQGMVHIGHRLREGEEPPRRDRLQHLDRPGGDQYDYWCSHRDGQPATGAVSAQ